MDQGKNRNVTFGVLLAGIAAYGLLQSLVAPVLPTLEGELHTSQDTATWLMTGYLLSASVATPILGRIGDRVGKRKMLFVSLAGLAVGSVIAGLSSSIGLLIVARVIQGLGGGVLPLSFGIIRDEFPAEKVRGAVGIASALITVGAGVGLLVAGPIVENMNYHWLFWIPAIMTTAAAGATLLFVPESPVRTPGRISWSAASLLSLWLVALLLGGSEGPTWGWGSGRVLGLFALAVIGLVTWIAVELRLKEPLIDMRMMRIPAVWTANLAALLLGVGMYTTMTFLPQYVQTPKAIAGYGLSASITQSGVYILPLTITMFVVGMLAGRVFARIGAKRTLIVGSVVNLPSFLVLAVAHDHSWAIYVSSALLGIGVGLAFSALSAIVVEGVPAAQTGVASGMNANIRTIGGAIGGSVAASILASGVTRANSYPPDSSYGTMFWFLTGSAVLTLAAAFLVPTYLRAHGQQPVTIPEQPQESSAEASVTP